MGKRIMLYEEGTNSSQEQLNPITDISSVYRPSDMKKTSASSVNNSIFINGQDDLLNMLSRIDSWLYKLRNLNNYSVAENFSAYGSMDLALEKNVSLRFATVTNQVTRILNDIDDLQDEISSSSGSSMDAKFYVDLLYNLPGTSDFSSGANGAFYSLQTSSGEFGELMDRKIIVLAPPNSGYDRYYYVFWAWIDFYPKAHIELILTTNPSGCNITTDSDGNPMAQMNGGSTFRISKNNPAPDTYQFYYLANSSVDNVFYKRIDTAPLRGNYNN